MENLKKRPSQHRAAIEGDGGAPELARSVMGVFALVVQRAYSAVARLNSIGTSSVCNTHNIRYRCRQSAIGNLA
jgi:3-deoxy-D-manno-octulosonic-acid transferase